MEQWWVKQLTLVTMVTCLSLIRGENLEFSSETVINNVVLDPRTGHLYVGAVNHLYHLNPNLNEESKAKMGPESDDKLCTPPITRTCESAKMRDNHNKLLLVHAAQNQLVVCGSIYRGLCLLKNLSNVEETLYFSDTNGEKSYVTSAEEHVSVVSVMSHCTEEGGNQNRSVFVVGKGYGSYDSNKLIATRVLEKFNQFDVFESIVDASAVQSNSFIMRNRHNFRLAFTSDTFIYFLFSRVISEHNTRNATFISRLCENDRNYFSYTELQLNCSASNKYNRVQAGFVATAGDVLARNLSSSGQYGPVSASDKVLFVTFMSDESSSALCVYPLKAIDNHIKQIVEACYKKEGFINGKPAVYSPYSTHSVKCTPQPNLAHGFQCGAEFLPSPLASRPEFALTADPSLIRNGNMSAIAVAVENGHSVAFVGTVNGEVLKVHLSSHPEVYGRALSGVTGDKVNKDLLFDTRLEHLYVTTEKKITKVPVQACSLKPDCHSCISSKDPYCGWCVLEGRCTTKKSCNRSAEKNAWLWAPDQQCVQIKAFDPPNLSCKKKDQVEIEIALLPHLSHHDNLTCVFNSFNTSAAMVEGSVEKVACSLPSQEYIPVTPEQKDFVSVPVKIFMNGTVELTSGEYNFYNCAATVQKNPNTPCISCVESHWGCQWNALDLTCSDADETVSGGHIIRHKQTASCPQFEALYPQLLSVNFKTHSTFQGRNLDIYKGQTFTIGTDLMKEDMDVSQQENSNFSFDGYKFVYDKQQEVKVSFYIKDKKSGRKIDSTLTVSLYNCTVEGKDCSLCKNADTKYDCEWCSGTKTCVFRKLCLDPQTVQQCPNPEIKEIVPQYGPMNGSITVTIKGSNMGIKKEDVKKITVAGVECRHLEERYSVSTSVVCEIGAKRIPPHDIPPEPSNQGPVEIEIQGGRFGKSRVNFTYRDPKPTSVYPEKGPAAGGTVIRIDGENLYTASKDDVTIFVGGIRCEVLSFNESITCKTSEFRDQKVPSTFLTLTMKYGNNTTKDLPKVFHYVENPKIKKFHPNSSFVCGGRKIFVSGSGFDVIQSAEMKVKLVSDDEVSGKTGPIEFSEEAFNKSSTDLWFHSPFVNQGLEGYSIRTFLKLDNFETELKNFVYHPDPTFKKLDKNVITEGTMIFITGYGFNKAMSTPEAVAFIGDTSCNITLLSENKLIVEAPTSKPKASSTKEGNNEGLELSVKFGYGRFPVDTVYYSGKEGIPFAIIIPAVIIPMLIFIAVSVYCYRRKSRQAEREYEKVKNQLAYLEESVRDRCKKEFTDLMIEMEDHTSDLNDGRIPFLDYKTYTERNFFLPSKEGSNDPMITGKIQIPEGRSAIVNQALNQFSNLLNSKTFLINFIRTLESRPDFNARSRGYFASLLTVALHGKLEYYTDIMRTLLLELMDEHVQNKNPKLMLRRSETVVERMLCNWMSICLYQFLRDTAGEPLFKLYKALKHQVEKGPVDAKLKKAKYTLNDTGLLGDDVEYSVLTLQVLVHGEGPDVTLVKVLNCDTITQVKEKIIDQVYRNLPYSQRPKVESVALEWRPGSTGQILSDLDLTSVKEGHWKRLNTLAHYNVRDNATLVLSRVLHTQSFHQHQENQDEKNALLEDDNTFHLVRPTDELDEVKSKRGSLKGKAMTKAITEIYLTRLLSVKGTLQQFVDDFFSNVLCSSATVPPAVKYFFDFLDEQAQRHDNVDEETLHIWKTNSLPMRFWVNILRNPHFIFDVHVTEVVDASLHVIAQTFMDACTKTEHKLSRESPSNKLLYAKEISTYKKMVDDYYRGVRQMVSVSDQDMNTHLAEVSRQHTHKLNTQVALHQLYQYASKYFDLIIQSLDEDPASQSKQLTLRLQQVAAALENKVTDL